MRVHHEDQPWVNRHGGLLVKVGFNQYLLPDGASVINGLPSPLFRDPPADLRERFELRKRFHTAMCEAATHAFHSLKKALTGKGNPYRWDAQLFGTPPNEDKAALLKLKALAEEHTKAVEELDRQLGEEVPDERQRRSNEVASRRYEDAANSQALKRLVEIEAINL